MSAVSIDGIWQNNLIYILRLDRMLLADLDYIAVSMLANCIPNSLKTLNTPPGRRSAIRPFGPVTQSLLVGACCSIQVGLPKRNTARGRRARSLPNLL